MRSIPWMPQHLSRNPWLIATIRTWGNDGLYILQLIISSLIQLPCILESWIPLSVYAVDLLGLICRYGSIWTLLTYRSGALVKNKTTAHMAPSPPWTDLALCWEPCLLPQTPQDLEYCDLFHAVICHQQPTIALWVSQTLQSDQVHKISINPSKVQLSGWLAVH